MASIGSGLRHHRNDDADAWRVSQAGATIVGTSGDDVIHRDGDGHTAGFGQTDINTVTTGNDTIDAGNGNDFVFADLGNDKATGGDGNDYLFGDDGNDTLIGNNGNDTLIGGQGVDKMTGGAGTDLFTFAAASEISGLAETIDGGSDVDTLDFRSASGPIDLSAATITNVETLLLAGNDVTLTADQLSEFSTIGASFGTERLILSAAGTVDLANADLDGLIDEFRGTTGNDTFIMTGVANGLTINTLDGADSVTAGNGNDTVNGGAGNDMLAGNDGNDTLIGGDDVDTLGGGTGNDLLIGGAGADTINGAAGNDDIAFQFVSDISGLAEKINGGADYDILDFARYQAGGVVDLSLATITNMEELDLAGTQVTLTAAQLSQFHAINGSFGYDTITLSAAGTADLTGLSGGALNLIDEFFGSSGGDTFIFTGAPGGVLVDGAAGNDTITGGALNDTLLGSAGADTLNGSDGNDVLVGGQDADILSGGVGYDTFRFNAGSDISGLAEIINGGSDIDTLDFQTNGPSGPIDLSTVTINSVETLLLGGNDVTLTADQLGAFTTINGGFGAERLILSAAGTADLSNAAINLIDEIRGSAGDDTITLTGVASGQTVNGMDGADRLIGSDGGDAIGGGAGADVINAGAGNDILVGGASGDTLTGGDGVDTFRYLDITDSAKGSVDTIKDFLHGTDVLDLAAIDANSEVTGNQGFSFIGSAAFSHTAGELQYDASTGKLLGDVNGDGVADLQISFANHAQLTVADIVL